MNFFVPYNMIEFFNKKETKNTGVFKSVMAQRIYLFLLHQNSGRIHKNDLKVLVQHFGSSKQNIQKSIKTLIQWQIVVESGDYYVAMGQVRFTALYCGDTTRLYKFTDSDLQNATKFKALIFKYIGQETASKKGTKLSNGKVIKQERGTGKYFVTEIIREKADNRFQSDIEDSSYNSHLTNSKTIKVYNPTITDLKQKQSLSYLGKATERSSRTVSRKLALISDQEVLGEEVVILKNSQVRQMSRCGFEHIGKPKDSTNPYLRLLESDIKSEAIEMKERFMNSFPILGESSFVAERKDGTFGVYQQATNVLTYSKVEFNSKLNRKVRFKISD